MSHCMFLYISIDFVNTHKGGVTRHRTRRWTSHIASAQPKLCVSLYVSIHVPYAPSVCPCVSRTCPYVSRMCVLDMHIHTTSALSTEQITFRPSDSATTQLKHFILDNKWNITFSTKILDTSASYVLILCTQSVPTQLNENLKYSFRARFIASSWNKRRMAKET